MRRSQYQDNIGFYNLTAAACKVQEEKNPSLNDYMELPQLFTPSRVCPTQESFAEHCEELLDALAHAMKARRAEGGWEVYRNDSFINACKGRLVRHLERHADIRDAKGFVDHLAESMQPEIDTLLADPMPPRSAHSGGWTRA